VSAFADIGTTGVMRRNQLQLNSTAFANLTQQFPGVNVSPSLQLASKTNFHLRASTGAELVVNLPVLNAPFRLYWSYNLRRVSQQIAAPPSVFQLPAAITKGLPFDTFESQILPQINSLQLNSQRINYFEPLSTFRFTVSRTF
jgi:outer membrane protein insertion porin family